MQKWVEIRKDFFATLQALSPSSSSSFSWNEPRKLWRHSHEALGKWILSQVARITSPNVNMLTELFFFPTEELLCKARGKTSRKTAPHQGGEHNGGLSYDTQLLRDLSLKSSASHNPVHMEQLKKVVEEFQLLKRCTAAAAEVEREMREENITPETALVPVLCVRHADDLSRNMVQDRIKDTIVELTARRPIVSSSLTTSSQNLSTGFSVFSSYSMGNQSSANQQYHDTITTNASTTNDDSNNKNSAPSSRSRRTFANLMQQQQQREKASDTSFNGSSSIGAHSMTNSNTPENTVRFPVVSIAKVTYDKLKRSYALFGEEEDMKHYGCPKRHEEVLYNASESPSGNRREDQGIRATNSPFLCAASPPLPSANERGDVFLTPHELFIRRAATVAFRYEGILATGAVQLCADLTFKDHLTAAGYYVADYCASPMNAYEGRKRSSEYIINKHLLYAGAEDKNDGAALFSGGPSTSIRSSLPLLPSATSSITLEQLQEMIKRKREEANHKDDGTASFLEGPHVFCSCFLDTDYYFGSLGSATRVPPQEMALAVLELQEKEKNKKRRKGGRGGKRRPAKEPHAAHRSADGEGEDSFLSPPPLLLTYDVPYDEDICELLFLKLEKDIRSSARMQRGMPSKRTSSTTTTRDRRVSGPAGGALAHPTPNGDVACTPMLADSEPGLNSHETEVECGAMISALPTGETISKPSPSSSLPLVTVDYVLVIPLWWKIPLRIDKTVFLPSETPIVVPVDHTSGNIIIPPPLSGKERGASVHVSEDHQADTHKPVLGDGDHAGENLITRTHDAARKAHDVINSHASMLAEGYQVSYTWPERLGRAVGNGPTMTTAPEEKEQGDEENSILCWNGVFLDEAYEYFCATTNQWLRGVTTTEVIALHSVVSVKQHHPVGSMKPSRGADTQGEKEKKAECADHASLLSSSVLCSSLSSSRLRSVLSSFYGGPNAMPPAKKMTKDV